MAPVAYAHQTPADSLATVAPTLAKLVPPVPTPSFVSDARQVLTPDEHVNIDQRIRAHQDAGLGDIAVAILPSVGEYAPADIALAIYRTWRVGTIAAIGSARRNLGVLMLIVPKGLWGTRLLWANRSGFDERRLDSVQIRKLRDPTP